MKIAELLYVWFLISESSSFLNHLKILKLMQKNPTRFNSVKSYIMKFYHNNSLVFRQTGPSVSQWFQKIILGIRNIKIFGLFGAIICIIT